MSSAANDKPEVATRLAAETMNPGYALGWTLTRIVFGIYFRPRRYHPERLPQEGPVILAANHASYLDPLLIGSSVRRPIHYLARESLFRFPVIASVLRSWKAVPVDREGGGAAGVRAILTRLASSHAVLLFPEGTRTRNGSLQTARSGVGLITLKSGASVVPVRVFGTYAALGRNHRVPRPLPVAVKFGRSLRFDGARKEADGCGKARLKELYQKVSDEIMAAIARLEPCQDKAEFP